MKVLVVGCGSIGKRHLTVLSVRGDLQISAYDVDPAATGNFIPNFTIGTAGAPGPWDNLCADSSCP